MNNRIFAKYRLRLDLHLDIEKRKMRKWKLKLYAHSEASSPNLTVVLWLTSMLCSVTLINRYADYLFFFSWFRAKSFLIWNGTSYSVCHARLSACIPYWPWVREHVLKSFKSIKKDTLFSQHNRDKTLYKYT